MFYLYYLLFSYNFAGMIENIKINMKCLFGLGGAEKDFLSRFEKIFQPIQRTVNVSSVAKVLHIRNEDIMIILANNGVNIGSGYLTKLTENHLEILWKVYSKKMNSYVSKSLNKAYYNERWSDDLILFYTHFNKKNHSSELEVPQYSEELFNSHYTNTFEFKKCNFSSYINILHEYSQKDTLDKWFEIDSEKLRKEFFDLIYYEDDKISSFEDKELIIDEASISLIFNEIKNEAKQSREILSKIIRKLSFKIKTKIKKRCNTVFSIVIQIILSCRYYIFTDDDKHPEAEYKVCASFG